MGKGQDGYLVVSDMIEKSKILKEKGQLAEARTSYDKAMEIWENADKNFIPLLYYLAVPSDRDHSNSLNKT